MTGHVILSCELIGGIPTNVLRSTRRTVRTRERVRIRRPEIDERRTMGGIER
jgi:hypothetical protein